jgi:hypothetical protein
MANAASAKIGDDTAKASAANAISKALFASAMLAPLEKIRNGLLQAANFVKSSSSISGLEKHAADQPSAKEPMLS